MNSTSTNVIITNFTSTNFLPIAVKSTSTNFLPIAVEFVLVEFVLVETVLVGDPLYKNMSKNVCPSVTFVYNCNLSPIVNVIRIHHQIDAYLNN